VVKGHYINVLNNNNNNNNNNNSWLGGMTVVCRTYDREVVYLVTIKLLLLGWVTVCGQVNHLGI